MVSCICVGRGDRIALLRYGVCLASMMEGDEGRANFWRNGWIWLIGLVLYISALEDL
jgi:hypothetical protein